MVGSILTANSPLLQLGSRNLSWGIRTFLQCDQFVVPIRALMAAISLPLNSGPQTGVLELICKSMPFFRAGNVMSRVIVNETTLCRFRVPDARINALARICGKRV